MSNRILLVEEGKTMMAWFQRAWGWLATAVVLGAASFVWWLSARRSGWAAERIMALQGDVELRVERIHEKKTRAIKKLDDAWSKRRKKLVQREQRQLAKVREEAVVLEAAALKRKVLEDLDEPL